MLGGKRSTYLTMRLQSLETTIGLEAKRRWYTIADGGIQTKRTAG